MKKVKPTVMEALSPWGDPWDKAQTLQYLANELDKVAGRVGSTELTSFQANPTLGLSNVWELRDLKRYGLDVYCTGADWCVDTRKFREWCNRKIEVLKKTPRPKTLQQADQVARTLF
ncbi:hypothetical protein OZX72_02960 [Bifidobacterium sp. ESL0769]|uniref:hypothetical protein n=1 Tax=Bifidobacterium sp. ESL0769 TaxID=2983229 RepID=UPI0023F89929|nr:hypothetical protein [Bifidobacterium sp. ESL0769]WEV67959.1 hypothetical protein OZX72_02960 [Bifidobacterium sp. ESL0769]